MKTETIKDFLELNRYTESYRDIKQAEGNYNPWLDPEPINPDIQSKYILEKARRDLEVLNISVKEYNKNKGFRQGDRILLPNGKYVMIVYSVFEEIGHVQTSNPGQFNLNKYGGTSYSGPLDSGLNTKDLIPTDKTVVGEIWFFHEGYAGGHRGVHANIEFRVYKTREGADLSGIPQATN